MTAATSSELSRPDARSVKQQSRSIESEPDYLTMLARIAVNVIISERGRPATDVEEAALMRDAETLAQAIWIALRKGAGPVGG